MANPTPTTRASRIPTETQFLDSKSPSGVAQPWLRALQSLQAQDVFNPISLSATPQTVGALYNVLFIATGAGAFTVNLGPSKSAPFSFYVIVKADAGAGAITIKATTGDTVNGAATYVQTNSQWRCTLLIPDGRVGWLAVSLSP